MSQAAQKKTSVSLVAFSNALIESWMGVILAGPIFGVTCVIFNLFIASWGGPLPSLGPWLLIFVLAAVVGGIIAAFASVFAIVLIHLFFWSLGVAFSPRTGVVIFGGLSGFAAISPVYSFGPGPPFDALWSFYTAILVMAAMVFGQVCGLWLPVFLNPPVTITANDQEPSTFQFQIRHLLVITGWVGLVIAVDRIWLNNGMIKLVAIYVVAQFVLLLASWSIFAIAKWINERQMIPDATG